MSNSPLSFASVLAILAAMLPTSTARAQTASEQAAPPAAPPVAPAPNNTPAPPLPQAAPYGAPAPQQLPPAGYQAQPMQPGYAPAPPAYPAQPAPPGAPPQPGYAQPYGAAAPAAPPTWGVQPSAPPAATPSASTEPSPAKKDSVEPPAHERFGQGFQVALSAENLFGYAHEWDTLDVTRLNGSSSDGLEVSGQLDVFSFLGNAGKAHLAAGLGLDVVVAPGITLGGALYYAARSGEQTFKSGTTTITESTEKLDDDAAFGIAARGGYALMFTDTIGIWPRVGMIYRTATSTSYDYSGSESTPAEAEGTLNLVVLSAGMDLVVSPIPHFALLVGPKLNLGLVGSSTVKSGGITAMEGDLTAVSLGASAGLMGYL